MRIYLLINCAFIRQQDVAAAAGAKKRHTPTKNIFCGTFHQNKLKNEKQKTSISLFHCRICFLIPSSVIWFALLREHTQTGHWASEPEGGTPSMHQQQLHNNRIYNNTPKFYCVSWTQHFVVIPPPTNGRVKDVPEMDGCEVSESDNNNKSGPGKIPAEADE